MKANLQWEVTEFFFSVPLSPTAKFHDCWGEWGPLSRSSCTLTQKAGGGGGFPLLKADSQQWGHELQCHTQKTRIKALLAWFAPIPSLLSYPAGSLDVGTPVSPGSTSWDQARTARKAEPRVGSGMDRAGNHWESARSSQPSLGEAGANTQLCVRSNPSQLLFSVFSTSAPQGCWLRRLSAQWPKLRFHIRARTKFWLVTGKLCRWTDSKVMF